MRLTRKRADGRSARSSGIKYDDRSPPDDRKSIRDGRKASVAFTPDVTAGFTPEPSPFEQMSQEELNAQAKTLLSAAGYGPQNR